MRYRAFRSSWGPIRQAEKVRARWLNPSSLFGASDMVPSVSCHRAFQGSRGRPSIFSKLAGLYKQFVRNEEGRLVGTDENGNRFFEMDRKPGSSKQRPLRYFLVPKQNALDDAWMHLNIDLPKVTAEWEAWLRHRRAHPPSPEEIAKNREEAETRRQRAQTLEANRVLGDERSPADCTGPASDRPDGQRRSTPGGFPIHPGYELPNGEQR
nr:unnamed protein product [Spirometra erinaceieuropaei]